MHQTDVVDVQKLALCLRHLAPVLGVEEMGLVTSESDTAFLFGT